MQIQETLTGQIGLIARYSNRTEQNGAERNRTEQKQKRKQVSSSSSGAWAEKGNRHRPGGSGSLKYGEVWNRTQRERLAAVGSSWGLLLTLGEREHSACLAGRWPDQITGELVYWSNWTPTQQRRRRSAPYSGRRHTHTTHTRHYHCGRWNSNNACPTCRNKKTKVVTTGLHNWKQKKTKKQAAWPPLLVQHISTNNIERKSRPERQKTNERRYHRTCRLHSALHR